MSTKVPWKVITPLDYLGPSVSLSSMASITANSIGDRTIWSGSSSKGLSQYTTTKVVLMDDILFSENTQLNSSKAGKEGEFSYILTLMHSTNQPLSRYCKFRFRFRFTGSAVSKMTVGVTVKTPFNTSGKILTTVYNSGISLATTYTTPDFYVDWMDPTTLENNVD